MLFPWQHHDWQRLYSERERRPNAWLFTGLAGIGKLEFAKEVAQSLLCESLTDNGEACGLCEGCRWFLHGTHPDFRLLSPEKDDEEDGKEKESAKPTRKLPVIKIEAVREVIEFAHLTAHRCGQRVIVIEPAEALNLSAANALLKILEEPPQNVLFLLVAHAPQRLLATIRSRCREFTLTAPDHSQALSWLQQQGVDDAEQELALHGGAPLFDHDAALVKLRKQFVQALATPSFANVLMQAELIDKQKLPLGLALEWLMKWLHDLACLKLTGEIRYFPAYQTSLANLGARADLVQLMHCQDALIKLAPYGQHTLNTRLQLEALLMDYLKIFVAAQTAQ